MHRLDNQWNAYTVRAIGPGELAASICVQGGGCPGEGDGEGSGFSLIQGQRGRATVTVKPATPVEAAVYVAAVGADVGDFAGYGLDAGQIADGDGGDVQIARIHGVCPCRRERCRLKPRSARAAKEGQPVIPAGVVHKARICCAVWLNMARALPEITSGWVFGPSRTS